MSKTLELTSIKCIKPTTTPAKDDNTYLLVDVDGTVTRYPSKGEYNMKAGSVQKLDLKLTYKSYVVAVIIEQDAIGSDDLIGTFGVSAESEVFDFLKKNTKAYVSGDGSSYELTFKLS